MLKDSQFAQDVKVAEKLLNDGIKSLNLIKKHIEHENKQLAVQEAIKYEVISEKIVNNARLIPIASGIPNIENQINENIILENNIEIKYLNDNKWFYTKIPSLLPKKEKGNPSYIRATLQIALKKYFSERKETEFCGECKNFPCDTIMTKPHSTVLDKDWLAWKKNSESNR